MKVTKTGDDDAHRAIFEDPLTEELVETVHSNRPLLAFVASVLRNYQTRESLTDRPRTVRQLAGSRAYKKIDQSSLDKVCNCIEKLYAKFYPGTVRGVVLEAMVERSIQAEYGCADDMLENNILFRVEDGDGNSHTTSTSIDVIGVCTTRARGECHDCKVASKRFDPDWIKELTEQVAPFGLKIGMASLDSTDRMREGLKRAGIKPSARGVLIGSDTWWTALPLIV